MGPASYLVPTWLIAVLKPLGRILRASETAYFVRQVVCLDRGRFLECHQVMYFEGLVRPVESDYLSWSKLFISRQSTVLFQQIL